MALLGESLVEEWLNREGFFTIRGVKHGVGEMDLLAKLANRKTELSQRPLAATLQR